MPAVFYLLAGFAIVRFALTGIVPESWFSAVAWAGYWCAKITCLAIVALAVVAVGAALWPRSEPVGGLEGAGRLIVPPLVMTAPAGR